MPEKILFDTDIGTNIDDAVCLAYLLANPDAELLGITTVTGQAVQRASMVSAMCKVAGREVPILPGAELPLLTPQKQWTAEQAAALRDWDHDREFPMGQAVFFMRDTIRANPGEVTLLSVGPLTNVALLFALDPGVPKMLKRLVMMCGVFTDRTPGAGPVERNAANDPHATAIVYRHTVPVHRSVGLDVTRRVTMPAAEVKRRFSAHLLKPVLNFAEIWFENAAQVTFNDPLAAVSVFDERVCQFQRGTVAVELAEPRLAGMTRWDPGRDGPHEVAADVNPELFFNSFFEVFE